MKQADIMEKEKARDILRSKLTKTICSDNPMMYALYGHVWLDRGDFDIAMDEYDKAVTK
jgi:hypothetical protein